MDPAVVDLSVALASFLIVISSFYLGRMLERNRQAPTKCIHAEQRDRPSKRLRGSESFLQQYEELLRKGYYIIHEERNLEIDAWLTETQKAIGENQW